VTEKEYLILTNKKSLTIILDILTPMIPDGIVFDKTLDHLKEVVARAIMTYEGAIKIKG
jgi:hypothetical protein